MQNRSKFVQLTSSILLEYIINENNLIDDNINNDIFEIYNRNPIIIDTLYKNKSNETLKLYTELNNDKLTNNYLLNTAIPTNEDNSEWFQPNCATEYEYINSISRYIKGYNIINNNNFTDITSRIRYDIIRLHILSGYSFGDIFGFLLQIKTLDKNYNDVKLCNLLHKKSNNDYIFEKPLIINNKIYDKYIEIKIPSSKDLRNIENPSDYINFIAGENGLNFINDNIIKNIEIVYSNILKDSLDVVYDENRNAIGNTFKLNDYINVELPYESESDKFNIFLEESSVGDYINFYCTWDNEPINISTVNAFNTRIKLYSSNGYTEDAIDSMYIAKEDDMLSKNNWVIYHEISTMCYDNNNRLIESPQIYTINQTFNRNYINSPVKFKYMPIIDINNSSDLSYITFEYIAKLINTYDGTQIVRKGALTTFNVHRYISSLSKINTSYITNYNVFNKINKINEFISTPNVSQQKNKFIKEYINYNNIIDSSIGNRIKLKKYGGKYLFNLQKINEDGTYENLDLLSTSSYVIVYKDSNNKINEINCTYSENMNMVYGQLEFNISQKDTEKMMNANDKTFAIKSKGLDGTNSTLIEIDYEF